MPRLLTTCLLAACATSFAARVEAARVGAVEIRGLDAVQTGNVRNALSLVDAIGRDLSARRLGYLVREADDETREALEPFGIYSPAITIQRSDRDSAEVTTFDPTAAPVELAPLDAPGTPEAQTAPITVTITVERGEPVRVRAANVDITGEGGEDKYLLGDLADFEPTAGDVFDHDVYEASKARISRRLAERGYFDADFASRRVEVTRAAKAADIDLRWASGIRYDMGTLSFVQTPAPIVRTDILDKLVYWDPGSYWHQGKLDRLRESLVRLDYFAGIDIEPRPENKVGTQVPVTITLTPAKRSVYTAGASYGTESGAGVRLGVERRYLNDRGHKAQAQLDYAQQRKTLTLQYRIPAFAWLDGWYTFSAQALDEQTDYIDTRKVELIASRSGEITRTLTAIASLHALRERWAYLPEDADSNIAPDFRFASYVFPSLRGEYVDVDNRMHARRGLGGTAMVRGGIEGVGSDASFAQAHVTARWFRGLDARSRLLVRGELGRTLTDSINDIPPSLRFYAGGDRSIRGYAYREVGPVIESGRGRDDYSLGARNVITGSVEYERYFSDQWGGAVFVDTGSAFDDSPEFRTGVGVGVRWKSPVGPLRVDVARGLDDPDTGFQVYLTLGADL